MLNYTNLKGVIGIHRCARRWELHQGKGMTESNCSLPLNTCGPMQNGLLPHLLKMRRGRVRAEFHDYWVMVITNSRNIKVPRNPCGT